MHLLRTVGRALSANILKLSLFGLALSFALVSVLGTPDTLKDSLNGSGIYDQAIDSVLDQAQKETTDEENALPLERPEIRQAVQESFPPDQLRTWAESFIDGIYGWLNGRTEKPDFRIDLTEARQSFIRRIADYAEDRMKSLPACSVQESLALSRQDIDPFTVQCRPPVNIAREKRKLVDELEKSDEFLSDQVITAEDLSSEDGEGFDAESNNLPERFQLLKRLPLLLVILSGAFALGTILLSDSRRRGLRKVGIILLGTGLFVLISTLVFTYAFNAINQPDGALGRALDDLPNAELQASVLNTVRSVHSAFNRAFVRIAAAYIILGGGILLALYIIGRKQKTQHPSENQENSEKQTEKPAGTEQKSEPAKDSPDKP